MFLIDEPSPRQIADFRRYGYLVVERIIAPEAAARLASRFGPLFRGELETGLYPDEWSWREGRDAEDLTRQICNAWKSDREVARAVLHPRVGLWCARLRGWPGARINQDDSYQDWVVPPEMCTCWIALDDTNRSRAPRRALVSHCMSSEARFHPTKVGYVYGRYKRAGSTEMDESFFPVLWTEGGYRSGCLDEYLGVAPA